MKNKDWVNPPNLFYQEVVYYDLRMDQRLKGEQVVYKRGHVLHCLRSRDLRSPPLVCTGESSDALLLSPGQRLL